MKKLLLVLMALFLWAGSSWGQSAIIGTGTSTTNGSTADPVERYYNYEHFQIIYLASELTTAGVPSGATINALGFSISESAVSLANYTIQMAHTTATTPPVSSGFSTVRTSFTYTPVVQAAGSFDMISFSSNFVWNGTDNIVIDICTGSNPFTSPYGGLRYTSTGTNYYTRYVRTDGSSNCATAVSTGTYNRPNIRFDYTSSSPFLTATPGANNFGYVANGSYGYSQYVLAGDNLTGYPDNIVVTAPAGFEVSLDNSNWYGSVNVPFSDATLSNTDIFTRFAPTGPMADYSGVITNVGGGASQNVNVSGTSYWHKFWPTSGASTAADEDIFNVTIGTINNSSTCSSLAPGAGSVQNQYSNYFYDIAPPDFGQTSSVSFSVSSGTCGGNYGNAFKIFIDFNQDGDFLDSGEEVYVSPSSITGPHTETGSISVPGTATLGETMMRVVNVETSTPSSISSFGTYSWGETEDYRVNISEPPACIAPASLTTTNITNNGADLNWTSIDSFFDIFIEVSGGPAPGPGTTPTVDNWEGYSYTWTGGTSSTAYQWWVRTDCEEGGGTGVSDWSGPGSFTTLCDVFTLPFGQSFDAATLPACWSQTSTISPRWSVSNSNNAGGSPYEMYAAYTSGTGTTRLISPAIDLFESDPYLIYKQLYDDYGVGVTVSVQTSIDGGAHWTTEWSHAGGDGDVSGTNVVHLTNFGPSTLIAWCIDGNHYQYDAWYVDDVVVQDGAPVIPGLWTGFEDSDWHNGTNWDDGMVPDITVDVTIPAGCPNYPVLGTTPAACNKLTVAQNATMSWPVDSFFDIFTECSNSGTIEMTGGTVNIGTYLFMPATTSVFQMSDGTLNLEGIFQNAAYTWSPGTFNLSGGTINQNGSAFFYGGTGSTMSGYATWNVGGTLQIPNDMWTMTDGTINLLGTEAATNYFLPPTGTGTAVAWNLNVNAPGAEYIFSRDATINNDIIHNDLTVTAGNVQLQSALGTGYPGTFSVGASVTVQPGAGFDCTVGTSFSAGNIYLKADATGYASWIDNGLVSVAKGDQQAEVAYSGEQWHMITPLIPDAVSGLFITEYLQEHSEISNEWTDIVPVDIPLNVGQGYGVYSTTAGLNKAIFDGSFNTGSVTTNLTRTDYGWNALGNPFPSPIDWYAVTGWTKTNVADATYVENDGLWASYIAGVGANGGSRYIAPAQGFFVECTDGGGGVLGMTKDVRTLDVKPDFLKNAVPNLVRLSATGNGKTDETVIRFHESATAGFDYNYDARKLMAFDEEKNIPNIYSSDNSGMSINSLPETALVPVGFNAQKSGVYTISATEINDLAIVLLEDLTNGQVTDLKAGSYTFNYATGDNDNRFVIHFAPLGINNPTADNVNVYSDQKEIFVVVPEKTQGTIQITNLLGQDVASTPIHNTKTRISVTEGGYYFVKVLGNNGVVTKKVFVR